MAPKKRKVKAKRRAAHQANDVITVSATNASDGESMDCNDRQGKKYINKRLGKKKKVKRGRNAKSVAIKNVPAHGDGIDETPVTDVCDDIADAVSNGEGKVLENDGRDTANEEVAYGNPDVTPECITRGPCIIDVTCGDNAAVLFMKGLSTGSKGACVLFEQNWLTPNEFQYVSGRESAKDWKRSIKHHGKSLKILVARGLMCLKQRRCKCCSCEGKDKEEPSVGSPPTSVDQGEESRGSISTVDSPTLSIEQGSISTIESVEQGFRSTPDSPSVSVDQRESDDPGSTGSSDDQSQDTVCDENSNSPDEHTSDEETETDVNEADMANDMDSTSQTITADDHVSTSSMSSSTENAGSDEEDSSVAEHEAAVTLALARLDVDLNSDSNDELKAELKERDCPEVYAGTTSDSTLDQDHDTADAYERGVMDESCNMPLSRVRYLQSEGDIVTPNSPLYMTSQSESIASDTETAQSDTEIDDCSVGLEYNEPIEAVLAEPLIYEDITETERAVMLTLHADVITENATEIATVVETKVLAPIEGSDITALMSNVASHETDEQFITSDASETGTSSDLTGTLDCGDTNKQCDSQESSSCPDDVPLVNTVISNPEHLAEDPVVAENIDLMLNTIHPVVCGVKRKAARHARKRRRGGKRKCQSLNASVMDKKMKRDISLQNYNIDIKTGSPLDMNKNNGVISNIEEPILYGIDMVDIRHSSSNNGSATEVNSSISKEAKLDDCDPYAVSTESRHSETTYNIERRDKTNFIESINLTERKALPETDTYGVRNDSTCSSSTTPKVVSKHGIDNLLSSTGCGSQHRMLFDGKHAKANTSKICDDGVEPEYSKVTANVQSELNNGEMMATPSTDSMQHTDYESAAIKQNNVSNNNCISVKSKFSRKLGLDTTYDDVATTSDTMYNTLTNGPVEFMTPHCSGTLQAVELYKRDTANHGNEAGQDGAEQSSRMVLNDMCKPTPRIGSSAESDPYVRTPVISAVTLPTRADPCCSDEVSDVRHHIPALPNQKHKSRNKGSRLMSIIDGLRTAPLESKQTTSASTSTCDTFPPMHKSRKISAPKQYCSSSQQHHSSDSSETENDPSTCSIPKTVGSTDEHSLSHSRIYSDPKHTDPQSMRCSLEHRPITREPEPESSKSAVPVPLMPTFPMLPYPMNIPPALLASMMQSGVPLEWQLALMNRQLGPNELALLTSAMNHQSGFLSGKSESKHIMPPSGTTSHRGSSSGSGSNSSKSQSSGVHSRGYHSAARESNHGNTLQTGLSNGRASSRPYPAPVQRPSSTSSSSSSSNTLRTGGHSSHSLVHSAFGGVGGQSSEHLSYREALSQRAMATMHRTGAENRHIETPLSWDDLRGHVRPTSMTSSAKQDALDLTKRYNQTSQHQRPSAQHSSQQNERPKQHGGSMGQPLDLSFRK